MSRSFTKRAVAVAVAAGLVAPGLVFGQSTADDDEMLEEIIVTARKVGESIQDIPLSVQAFTAQQILEQQIVDVEDLVQFTPGVVMSNQIGSRNNPVIRFRGIDPPSAERNKQISSAFVDGVYLPGTAQWVGMNDVERVEVVKGPQSAFFGRATFSGAINFVTKTPGDEWGVDVSAIVGDNSRQDIWVSAEGPIIEDKLAIRASGRYYSFDGAWENNPPPGGAAPGREYGDLGAQETKSASLVLFATPTDNLSIKLRHTVSEDDDGPSPLFLVKGERNNCGPFNGGTSNYFCGTLTTDLISNGISAATTPLADNTFADDLGLEREIDFTSLAIDWEIGNSGYTLSSLSGWYNDETSDYRTLLEDELDVFLEWEDETFSQELRLTSPQDRRFRWMIGAYYLDLEYFKGGQVGFPCTGFGPFCFNPLTGQIDGRGGRGLFGVNPQPSETVDNQAIFGSISYDITEKLTVSLEMRREEEDISTGSPLIQEAMPLDSSTPELAIATAQPFGGAEVAVEGTFKATLPRLILDYTINEDTMIYASFSEGNNPGGFNPEVIQLEPTVAFPAFQAAEGIGYTVEQAKLESFEFGAKHTFANGRGFLNGAVYLMEWTNQRFRGFSRNTDSNGDGVFIQGSDRLGGQIDYDSNGSTDIWGFEFAGSWAFNDNWRADVAYNYTDTEIQVYEDAVNGRVLGNRDASGLEIARSPDHAGTIALNYSRPSQLFNTEGEWWGRLDSWYQDSTYTWVVNLAETEASWLSNLRGGWRNEKYSVTAWVENLLDDDPVQASQRTTGSFLTGTLGYALTIPTPRTFGVTFTASFR